MTWSAEATLISAYKILGVAEDADREAIRAAYIELVKLNHPDLHGGSDGATERLKEINQAFNLLKDSARFGIRPAGRELQVLARRRRWPAVLFGVAFGTLAASAAMVIAHNVWKQKSEVPDFDPPVVAPPVVAATPSPIETLASVAASLPRQAERTPDVAASQPGPEPAASSATVDSPSTVLDPVPSLSANLSPSPEAVETAPGQVAEALPDIPARAVSATPAPLPPTPPQHKRRAVEPASLSQPYVRQVAALHTWTTFRNDHFGFKISYPPDFGIGTGKQDAFRRQLVSADGGAQLVISSGYMPETMTIASYRSELMRGPYRGARLDYAPLRDTWFVLSGDLGNRAFYERVTIACEGETFHGFRLVYPAAERAYYSQMIEIMHAGYKHARGLGPHCN